MVGKTQVDKKKKNDKETRHECDPWISVEFNLRNSIFFIFEKASQNYR